MSAGEVFSVQEDGSKANRDAPSDCSDTNVPTASSLRVAASSGQTVPIGPARHEPPSIILAHASQPERLSIVATEPVATQEHFGYEECLV